MTDKSPQDFLTLVFERVSVGNALSSADFKRIAGSYNQLVNANEQLKLALSETREAFQLMADAKLLATEAYLAVVKERDELREACAEITEKWKRADEYTLKTRDERDRYRAALERIANPLPFNAGDKIACLLSLEAFTEIAREALK